MVKCPGQAQFCKWTQVDGDFVRYTNQQLKCRLTNMQVFLRLFFFFFFFNVVMAV